MADYEDSDLPKFDKQKYHRHLRGWFSYAFARYVQDYSSNLARLGSRQLIAPLK